MAEGPPLVIQHADQGVLRADDLAGGIHEPPQQALRVVLEGQLLADLDERGDPRSQSLHLPRFLVELIGDQAQMLAGKLFGGERRGRVWTLAEGGGHRGKDQLRVGRLREDVTDAAGLRQQPRPIVRVNARVEDDGRKGNGRVRAQSADELVAIHGGHEDIGDDQVWALGLHHLQRLCAIRGIQDLIAVRAEERPERIAVGGPVLNDQYLWRAHTTISYLEVS